MTKNNENDMLLTFGSEIKALGDGKVGGFLVRFTDAKSADLDGDFFDAGTDYGIETGDRLPVYYNHGLDSTLKRRRIGRAQVDVQDVGVWVEAQLEMRDEYERAIYALIEKGKVGWSSGSMPHLVEREPQKGGASRITSWPLGEASITPTPAAGAELTRVQPLKLWASQTETLNLKAVGDTATEQATVTASDGGQTINVNITVNTERESVEEETKVSEETKVQEQPKEEVKVAAPVVDVDAIVKAVGSMLADKLEDVAQTVKAVEDRVKKIEDTPESAPVQTPQEKNVKVSKTGLGDSETKAFAAWMRTGDTGGVKHLMTGDNEVTLKASNDTDMNVGTSADGGYAVPTGHYNGIIARMHESALWQRLGVMMIPGKGTTVNVPIDNEADGEFVSVAETTAFDRDAPAIGQKQFTLVKYTKKIQFSYELLQDEDSRLLNFVEQWVGTGLARTHNSALITEVLASGTAGLTLDATAAIGAAEVPELMYKLKGEYADNAAWVLDRATEGYLRGLTGNNFQFVPTPQGTNAGSQANISGRELFGAPVFNTAYMPDIGAGNKSMLFGNFNKMGLYMAPDITFLRDPYSAANTGQVNFFYYTRFDYGVLIAEAFQYATHPTA